MKFNEEEINRVFTYVLTSINQSKSQAVILTKLDALKSKVDFEIRIRYSGVLNIIAESIKESLFLNVLNMLDVKEGILCKCMKELTESQKDVIIKHIKPKQTILDQLKDKIRTAGIAHHHPDAILKGIDKDIIKAYSTEQLVDLIPITEQVRKSLLAFLGASSKPYRNLLSNEYSQSGYMEKHTDEFLNKIIG